MQMGLNATGRSSKASRQNATLRMQCNGLVFAVTLLVIFVVVNLKRKAEHA